LKEGGKKSILDVGTGSGVFAEAFFNKNILVSGIDSNPEMLEAAKSYLPSCSFEVASAKALPFSDKSFDMLFMGLVFHEVDNYKKVIEEGKRVAIKQVAVLEWNYTLQSFGPPLEHRLRPEFLEQLSKEVGFTQLEIIPITNLVLYLFKI